MAREVLSGLSLGYRELMGLRIENRTGPPTSPADGDIYFDTTAGGYRLYQAGSWYELSTATPGTSTPVATMTESEYAALTSPDPNILYVIMPDPV